MSLRFSRGLVGAVVITLGIISIISALIIMVTNLSMIQCWILMIIFVGTLIVTDMWEEKRPAFQSVDEADRFTPHTSLCLAYMVAFVLVIESTIRTFGF